MHATEPFERPSPLYHRCATVAAVLFGGALFLGLWALLPRPDNGVAKPAPDKWAVEPSPARLRRRNERLA